MFFYPPAAYNAVYYWSGYVDRPELFTGQDWFHVAFVWAPTGSVLSILPYTRCFINGVEQTLTINNNVTYNPATYFFWPTTSSLKLGRGYSTDNGGPGGVGVRDIAFYTKALSEYEVREHFRSAISQVSGTNSSTLNWATGSRGTGSYGDIHRFDISPTKVTSYVTSSEAGSGSRGNPSKLNPGVN
jgi:hypothetical protein